jgi:hypothetical protein
MVKQILAETLRGELATLPVSGLRQKWLEEVHPSRGRYGKK